MKLNRTPNPLDRNARNKENDNWDIIEGEVKRVDDTVKDVNDRMDNFVDEVSDEALDKVVDNAKLDWDKMVDNKSDLPNSAAKGTTIGVKNDGKVYRFDGNDWVEIYEINLNPIAEVDDRLSSQLAQTTDEMFKSSLVNHKVGGFNVWWIDDDGHKGVYTKLAPLLREYGIKMSAAIITDRPHGFPISGLPTYDPNSQFMSYDEMKELENEGIVEFVPHSHTHDLNHRYTDMTLDEIHDDMSTCKSIIRQLGWNYKDLVYPFGAHNAQVREVARQYFRSAIDIRGGSYIPPVNQFAIPRLGMDTRDTQDIIEEINNAYENDTLIIVMSHVDQYGGLEESKMRAVIEHVLSLGGRFITGEEAITNYGNLLQIGEDSISFDGGIHSNRLGKVRVTKDNEFLASNVPSDFDTGITITKIDVSSSDNTNGLPFKMYGTLVVNKSSDLNNWTHQTFYAGFRNLIAYRHATAGDTWSEWYVNYMPEGHGELPDNSKPKDYPVGTTTTTIEGPNATETPGSVGGIIVTTKTKDSYLWTYQEFFDVTNNETYTRRADSLDVWRSWRRVKNFYHYDINEIDGTLPAGSYANGMTHVYVRNSPEGIPDNSGNLLTLNQFGQGRGCQFFRTADSSIGLFFRGENSVGDWHAWKRVVLEDI